MMPLLVGIGVVALLSELFSDEDGVPKRKIAKRRTDSNKRSKNIFISFAMKDKRYRDFLVAQARNASSPFTFVDMSVKKPWEQNVWKRRCREKIQKCDGLIVLLSKNTWHSSGARWEAKCAKEERVPIIGMHIKKHDRGAKPPELNGKKVIEWSWDNLKDVINNF